MAGNCAVLLNAIAGALQLPTSFGSGIVRLAKSESPMASQFDAQVLLAALSNLTLARSGEEQGRGS
jgi:hypothetical protein